MTEQEIIESLRKTLKPSRFEHSLGVTETAVKMAKVFGADENKCRLAGLIHDCAKSMSVQDMLSEINAGGIELYDGETDYPLLLHAPAGAALAKRIYGVKDTEVLSAVRKHTTGKDMNLIEKIIFVADFIEPGRESFDGLEKARETAFCDIDEAVKLCKKLTQEYCIANGQKVFSI